MAKASANQEAASPHFHCIAAPIFSSASSGALAKPPLASTLARISFSAGGRNASAEKPVKPAAESTLEAADVEPDDRTTAELPASDRELNGKGILDTLKSIDAVYAAAFTASGRRPG